MAAVPTIEVPAFRLAPFYSSHAAIVSGWVQANDELRWLAPSTPPPLTPDKVARWCKGCGAALVALGDRDSNPLAYGELNPMRHDAGHLWLGHVIVDPALRGGGIGRRFVEHLLREAFFARAARRISLIVFPENRPAVRCYERVGFRLAGEEHHRFEARGPLQRLLRFEISCPTRSMRTAAGPASQEVVSARGG